MPLLTAAEIGERIATRRRDLRLKQSALAAEAGMSQANISRIECGEQPPDKYQLKRIAKALGCTVGELIAATFASV